MTERGRNQADFNKNPAVSWVNSATLQKYLKIHNYTCNKKRGWDKTKKPPNKDEHFSVGT
ncbi:hypothetical protein [Bacillus sp. CH30_1T]|uniref:hypothetical protein n=1 Tax=Bacillus sp. CH30_1T TaxID=2604836 RepID=UPI00165EA62A|nr:hypothetical protein [Bacillus sp. CH30_1T]